MTRVQDFKTVAEILLSAEKGETRTLNATKLGKIADNLIAGNDPSLPTLNYVDDDNPTNEEKAEQALRVLFRVGHKRVGDGAGYIKLVNNHTEVNAASDSAKADWD